MPADHLFVYGTLRSGSDNQAARMLANHARSIGTARVAGWLYNFGQYPGARPGDGWITGEIFQLQEPDATLAALDDYEGPGYERALILVNSLDCWIYWYVGPEPGHLIESGDWFQR